MKKYSIKIIALLITFFSIGNAYSQIEITPFGGYFFSTNINFYQGQLKIYDGGSYGGHLGFHTTETNIIEFTYVGNRTTARWKPYSGFYDYTSQEFSLNSNYFLIGTVQDVPLNGNATGFGSLKVGAGYFNALENNIADIWRFSVSFGLGTKIFFSDLVGLRFQANMHMPLYFNGVGAYCGIGGGGSNCGLSMNSTAAVLQGDISAGLIFKLGK